MAISAGLALVSTSTTVLTAGTLIGGSILTHFFVTTALGAALNALSPKPSVGGNRGYEVTAFGPASNRQVIYGETKVAGVRVFDYTTGNDNKYLHRVLAFAGHEIESFEKVYFGDQELTLDGDGNITSPTRFAGKAVVHKVLGKDDQVAHPSLVSEVAPWTTDHTLSGIAYLYIKFTFDQSAYANGLPEVSSLIKGKKVYDPRTGAVEWSDNVSLCVLDYLSNEDYGLGEPESRLDYKIFSTNADVDDEITLIAGVPRYRFNGAFTTDITPYDFLFNAMSACGGLVWYSQGKWRIKSAYYTEPVLSLGEDDLRSAISVSTRQSRRDNFNAVGGTFKGAESDWQVTDFTEVTNSSFLDTDNGQKSKVDIDLPFTSSFEEARRLALISLERNRQQIGVQASFSMKAFKVQVGDNISLSISRFGWVDKVFEVTSWSFAIDANDGNMFVNMSLRETAPETFDEFSDGIIYEKDNTSLGDPFTVVTPTSLIGSSGTTIGADGSTVAAINFSWSYSGEEEKIDYYVFEYKKTTDTEWETRPTQNKSYVVSPVNSGERYNFRVRAINTLGVSSNYFTSGASVLVTSDTIAPSAPTNLVAKSEFRAVSLSWTNPTDNDFSYTEIYEGTTPSSSAATKIGEVSGTTFIRADLVVDSTRYYWLKAVDYSGNKSSFSSVASSTARLVRLNDAIQDTFTSRRFVQGTGIVTLPGSSSVYVPVTGEVTFPAGTFLNMVGTNTGGLITDIRNPIEVTLSGNIDDTVNRQLDLLFQTRISGSWVTMFAGTREYFKNGDFTIFYLENSAFHTDYENWSGFRVLAKSGQTTTYDFEVNYALITQLNG